MNRGQERRAHTRLMKGYVILYLVILYSSLPHVIIGFDLNLKPNTAKPKAKCDLCNEIYKKFNEALKSTEKANFGGGNTKWEEKSLGKFKYSETRLLEVIEMLCDTTNQECHLLVEQNEEYIEHYWYYVFPTEKPTDFHQWFCVDNIKVCCGNGTYGPHCSPCPGDPTLPCSGNGDCQGEGTREGTGKCSCHAAYMGDVCDECHTNYYAVTENTTHTVCAECDQSCKDSCREAGPKGCDTCKAGYVRDDANACIDVDECQTGGAVCEGNKFCLNTPGSYDCSKCHEACASCTGAGASNCVVCSQGYQLNGSVCQDIDECLDQTLCQGDNEKCENIAGSHFCGCIDGYIRSNDACIPKPTDESEKQEEKTVDKTQADLHPETPKVKEDL